MTNWFLLLCSNLLLYSNSNIFRSKYSKICFEWYKYLAVQLSDIILLHINSVILNQNNNAVVSKGQSGVGKANREVTFPKWERPGVVRYLITRENLSRNFELSRGSCFIWEQSELDITYKPHAYHNTGGLRSSLLG